MLPSEMKKTDGKEMEADQLAEIFLSSSSPNQISSVLDELSPDKVYDLSSTILASGHTLMHLLAQRQKLHALRALLQRGVGTQARNAQGATPLHVALQHNALHAAKVLIEQGGASVSEVVSRRKGTTLLHLMVTCDRPHAVMLLLDNKVEVNARDHEGRTPFHLAAVYGNSVVAAILIRHDQCDVNAVDETGHTALMLAITSNNQDLARQLVDAPRVDVVQRDKKGRSPLHLAVTLGQLEVVRTLLRRNTANINSKERSMGRTPIHLACALVCSRTGIVSSNCLFDEDAFNEDTGMYSSVEVSRNEDFTNKENGVSSNTTSVQDTADNSDPNFVIDTVSDACQQNVNLSVQSQDSLSLEGSQGEEEQVFVNGHSDEQSARTPRFVEEDLRTPTAGTSKVHSGIFLESAATVPSTKTPRLVTQRKQTSRQRFGNVTNGLKTEFSPRGRGKTLDVSSKLRTRHSISGEPVLRSPKPRQQSILSTPRKLFSPKASTKNISRPATAPASAHHRPIYSVSFAEPPHKTSVSGTAKEETSTQQCRNGTTLIVTPVNIGTIRCKLVTLLLEHGADANLMTAFRKSPLHVAAIMGASDVMAILLHHVTNINVLSASNKTALHLAVERNHVTVAAQLINAGANLALRDISGMTAMHIAARFGFANVIILLLKAKADMNCSDFKQMMPLHHACIHNHTQVIDLLIQTGARQNAVDVAGCMPLDYIKTMTITESNPSIDYSESVMDDINNSNTIPEEALDAADTHRQRKMAVFQNLVDNAISQPAQDFQKPGRLFNKNANHKAI